MTCPFCKLDPYEYVDVGIGSVPVGATCCEYGAEYYLSPDAQYDEILERYHADISETFRLINDDSFEYMDYQTNADGIPF